MFATHPEHEFPVPKGLADPGSQHWRLVELVLHVPWYLLTVAAVPEEDGAMLTQTWCFAWEGDLTHLLTTIDTGRVNGLLCMLPGRTSNNHQWTSRQVREVWLVRTDDDSEVVQFIDFEGNALEECSKGRPSEGVVERRLLLRMGSTDSCAAQ